MANKSTGTPAGSHKRIEPHKDVGNSLTPNIPARRLYPRKRNRPGPVCELPWGAAPRLALPLVPLSQTAPGAGLLARRGGGHGVTSLRYVATGRERRKWPRRKNGRKKAVTQKRAAGAAAGTTLTLNALWTAGERDVKQALRKALLQYKLHTDQELFDRAYGYIKQYY